MNIWESIRLWLLRQLKVDPAQPRQLRVQETLTFEDNAALNRLWYTGDADALSQVYAQLGGNGFWAKSAKNTQVQRIHTGIPCLETLCCRTRSNADTLLVRITSRIGLVRSRFPSAEMKPLGLYRTGTQDTPAMAHDMQEF